MQSKSTKRIKALAKLYISTRNHITSPISSSTSFIQDMQYIINLESKLTPEQIFQAKRLADVNQQVL